MTDSILNGTKKALGIEAEYTAFDPDIKMNINAVFATLQQLGIGPVDGFMIEDAAADWIDFIGPDPRLNNVKTYVFLRVRMLFDPPATSFHIQAIKEQIQELEWRLNVYRESTAWVDPNTLLPHEEDDIDFIFDGGSL